MSFSIEQWCQRHNISRSTYYKLVKAGKSPKTMKVLDCIRISEAADSQWVREREAESSSMTEAA